MSEFPPHNGARSSPPSGYLSPPGPCVCVHIAGGHRTKCRSMRATEKPGAQEAREGTPLFRISSLSNLPILAMTTPILSNGLFPGMIDRKLPFLFHPDPTGHSVYSSPVQSLPPAIFGEQTSGLPFAPFLLINNQASYMDCHLPSAFLLSFSRTTAYKAHLSVSEKLWICGQW